MPAPFVKSLAGLRTAGGNPNTSDNNDAQSVILGRELLVQLGVPDDAVGPDDPGGLTESETVADLTSRRPDLFIRQGTQASAFAQYGHLAVYPDFKRTYKGPDKALSQLETDLAKLDVGPLRAKVDRAAGRARLALEYEAGLVDHLLGQMPEESLLKIDVVVGEETKGDLPPILDIALSAKWSLRTDRAQDCVSQGSKLVALRRGRMPHFAVITMEPRPAMLKILADGSGSVDCVYHLDLPALQRTIEACAARTRTPERWSPKLTFDRLLRQGRIRDYEDLVTEVLRVPKVDPPVQAAATAP